MKRNNRLINFVYKLLQMPKHTPLIEGQRIRLNKSKLFFKGEIEKNNLTAVWIEPHYILSTYKITEENYLFTVICNSLDSYFVKNGDIVYLSKEDFFKLEYT